MSKSHAGAMALGGVTAALAVVIMSMGGLIPLAVYVSPLLCMLLLRFVNQLCGIRIGWTWYAVVALLSLLLSADKESVAVFLFMGYYPLVKPQLDNLKIGLLLKFVWFNGSVVLMYGLLIAVFGMTELTEEFAGMGMVFTAVTLVLANVTFLLTDHVLGMHPKRKSRGGS
jgi:hypothetical protein